MFLAFSPFYFQVFGASLLSLFWILFQVDCYFLFIYLVLWVSTLFFHLCYISLSFNFSFELAPLEVSFLQALGLYSFFLLVLPLEGKAGWMVCADFLLGVTSACVLVWGDQADQTGNYRNNGTYTHTSTHSYNQNILKKRVQEIAFVNKRNNKWY